MDKKEDIKKEFTDTVNRAINELVYEKTQIIKAYNYYHGKRDPEQFRHLEENYGIGTPTSVEFIPLVRKHIDVLIGEYLSTPVKPRVSCKDKKTLSNIFRDKQLFINSKLSEELKKHLNNTIFNSITGAQGNDSEVENRLADMQESLNRNFMSEYEIAGQNIIKWVMQSQIMDFTNQRKLILTDLLVSGTSYYKVFPSPDGSGVRLKVLNPVNTFIDRNPESPYLKNSMRAVVREYLTKNQILAKYGRFLTKDDLDTLENITDYSIDGSSTTYLRSYDSITGNTMSDGILGGFEVTPLLPYERDTSKYFRVFPTYEVEWLKTEKEGDNWVVNRYEGIRIGTNIYIDKGKAKDIVRSMDDKLNCTLSVNGIFYSDRNGDPFSLVLKTANLQDKNDLLYFYRDNIIAESGTVGDWVDMAYLPKFLGRDATERLMKWKAYKKASGMALFDSSQEGQPMVNTNFNGFDDTLKLQTIQAIDLAIQRNEETCSMITGVFREKLGGIEQKDAVTNVQVGVRQSTYITKQYYQIMDLMTREILIDIINVAKITFKKGISGTLVLGDRLNQIFTALPEYYTATDFDINIGDSAEIVREQETIKQLAIELTKGQMIEADTLVDLVCAEGLTDMREQVKQSILKKKQEANQAGQLQQQVEQLSNQLQQASQEAQSLKQQVDKLNEQKIQMDKERLDFEKQLEWFKAKDESDYNDAKLDWEKKRVQLEGIQLLDDNKRNDEVRNE